MLLKSAQRLHDFSSYVTAFSLFALTPLRMNRACGFYGHIIGSLLTTPHIKYDYGRVPHLDIPAIYRIVYGTKKLGLRSAYVRRQAII